MKWMFFVLVVVNLALAGFQWMQHRETKLVPVYESVEGRESIVLLSELSEVSGGSELPLGRCVAVGPSSDRKVLEVIKEGFGEEVHIIEKKIDKAPSYWVYIKDEGESGALTKSLIDIGVDSYKISNGELEGNLSLGVFENVDLARRLVKKLKGEGFSAKIFERKKVVGEFWLQFSGEYAAANSQKIRKIAATSLNNADMREIFCKSVASQK